MVPGTPDVDDSEATGDEGDATEDEAETVDKDSEVTEVGLH